MKNRDGDSRNEGEAEEVSRLRSYQAPELKLYGTLEAITRANGEAGGDASFLSQS